MSEAEHDHMRLDEGNESEKDTLDLGQSSQKYPRFEDGDEIANEPVEYKVFNDSIHGHILMHPLLVKIIDTPQFQRLRNIKQLGSTYFVYPGASHNRFEHCIGTSHLAGKLVRMLRKNQKNLDITDEDVLCVEMAGLCHDLGHGPYSHMFDNCFLPRVRQGYNWTHEKGSCMMFKHLIEKNKLWPDEFDKYNITKKDIIFVREMIAGPDEVESNDKGWPYNGRGEKKSFLYEIVSNERNKVDVDKWDYFARDCHHLGVCNSFDHNRFMQFTKVLEIEGERLQICARDKESYNLYEMFQVRSVLHRRAYQHRVANAIDHMICDAMTIAEPYIKFDGKKGKCTMSQCVDDPIAYTQLSDNIFERIAYSTEPELSDARNLLQRVLTRRLYQIIGATTPIEENSTISEEIVALAKTGTLEAKDLVYNTVKYNYGMKDKNPIDSFRFYSKSDPKKPYQIRRQDVSPMLPGVFEESELRVFCVSEDQTKVQVAKECFKLWCERKELKPKAFLQEGNDLMTPVKGKRSGGEDQPTAKKSKMSLFQKE